MGDFKLRIRRVTLGLLYELLDKTLEGQVRPKGPVQWIVDIGNFVITDPDFMVNEVDVCLYVQL